MQLIEVDALTRPTTRVVPFGWSPSLSAGDLLAAPGPVTIPGDWWSWAGAHGGLVVALAAGHAADEAGEGVLRSSAAQLVRAVRGPLSLRSTVLHAGRRLTTVRTEGAVDGRTAVVVHSTFGAPTASSAAGAADPLPAPLVHRPEDLPAFDLPAAVVPFAQHVEIRPTDDVLPLAGAPTARLTAWVRLREEHGTPGALRTTVLADALAPSLYAALSLPAPVPTVELTVHHRAMPPAEASDPWLLARARTDFSDEGWVSEAVDLWDRSGTHVATSRQLRVVT